MDELAPPPPPPHSRSWVQDAKLYLFWEIQGVGVRPWIWRANSLSVEGWPHRTRAKEQKVLASHASHKDWPLW